MIQLLLLLSLLCAPAAAADPPSPAPPPGWDLAFDAGFRDAALGAPPAPGFGLALRLWPHERVAIGVRTAFDLTTYGDDEPRPRGWAALAQLRLRPLLTSQLRLELTLQIGATRRALELFLPFFVDGQMLEAVADLRFDLQLVARPKPGVGLGPTLHLEAMPVALTRRVHQPGQEPQDTPRLDSSGRQALVGLRLEVDLAPALGFFLETAIGVSAPGDHSSVAPSGEAVAGLQLGPRRSRVGTP